MMAFFDSLIEREIEGWDSSSDSDEEQVKYIVFFYLNQNKTKAIFQDYSKLISEIFKYGRNDEQCRKYKSNRITQLISKKKHRLAKLARNKSLTYIQT